MENNIESKVELIKPDRVDIKRKMEAQVIVLELLRNKIFKNNEEELQQWMSGNSEVLKSLSDIAEDPGNHELSVQQLSEKMYEYLAEEMSITEDFNYFEWEEKYNQRKESYRKTE